MDTKTWVGVAFAAVTLVFFMVAYFVKPPTPSNAPIVRLLAAICAGAAGYFLTGTIAIQISGHLTDGANYAVSATGGIALFVMVWLRYPSPKLSPGFNVSFPQGTRFEDAATLIGAAALKPVTLQGFSQTEKDTLLVSSSVSAGNDRQALQFLHALAPPGSVRAYRVKPNAGGYQLDAK